MTDQEWTEYGYDVAAEPGDVDPVPDDELGPEDPDDDVDLDD